MLLNYVSDTHWNTGQLFKCLPPIFLGKIMTSSDKTENHSSVFPLQDWIHIHLYTCGSYILTAVSRLTVSCVTNQQTLQTKDDLNCLACLDLYPAAFEMHSILISQIKCIIRWHVQKAVNCNMHSTDLFAKTSKNEYCLYTSACPQYGCYTRKIQFCIILITT